MNFSIEENSISKASGLQIARLGAAHGYRFDGDTVRLSAMFTVLDPVAHQRQWALQLWACPAPGCPECLADQLVAEVALPPIGEIADDTESFEVSSPANLPVGTGDHVMVLALVCKANDRFEDVQDFADYPRRERFFQPQLSGNVGFRVDGGQVVIDVERIENPRDAATVTGTLALELWALPRAYRGGRFTGAPLAGVAFDSLSGQFEYCHRTFTLPYTPPPPGAWNIVLMLREWTAAGYVTRDFRNFAVPMIIATPALALAEKAERVQAAPAVAERKSPAAPRKVTVTSTVSVNTATKEQLEAIKGLPTKVAEGIVSKRPFKSLDDLTTVKGVGVKLLAKLRSRLRL